MADPHVLIAELLRVFEQDATKIPDFRRPKRSHINNLFPALKRRERLAGHSFAALHNFAAKNPDLVFL